jgi:putative DNA primase/helicase
MDHVADLLDLKGDLIFPVLTAVTTTPIVFHDGRLLQDVGYDEESGLYFNPLGVEFPPISEKPSKREMLKALAILSTLIQEFPFKVRPDEKKRRRTVARAAGLSYIMTVVNRPAWPKVPGHAFSGNQAGIGKGMLVSIGAHIATGKSPAVISQRKAEEELEKDIAARMIAGVNHIAIDNVTQTLESDLLDQALTEDIIFVRILGKSEGPEVPNTYTITATGNRLKFGGDALRRWIQCDLESHEARPELRKFKHEPILIIHQLGNRAKFVWSVLTIVKGYIAAGRPKKPDPLSSYNEWSDDVRGALMYLGEADPVSSLSYVRENDPARNLEERFVEAWFAIFGYEKKTTAQIIAEAKQHPEPSFKRDIVSEDGTWAGTEIIEDDRYPLYEVVKEVCDLKPQELSEFLKRRLLDKPVLGKEITKAEGKGHGGGVLWKLVDANEQGVLFKSQKDKM